MKKQRNIWHKKMKQDKGRAGSKKPAVVQRTNTLLFLLLLIFGIIITSHVQTVRAEFSSNDLETRYRQRQEDLKRYEEQFEKLSEENQLLNERREAAIADLLQREGQEDILLELQYVNILAGFTEVTGPGIQVILNDKPDYNQFTDTEDSIVHDGDIRHVLDLLRNAGAGAFSVNGQRIVNSSYIYCIGPTILCNRQRLTPPYVIEARGDPSALALAIEQDVMLAIRAAPGIDLVVEVVEVESVAIPAFADSNHLEPFISRLEVVR